MPSGERDKWVQNFNGAQRSLVEIQPHLFLEREKASFHDWHFSDQDGNIAATLPLPLHPTPLVMTEELK